MGRPAAERRKPPGSGAKPCYPMAKTDRVEASMRRSRPGLFCHCPFGALGRTYRVGWVPNGPPKPLRNRDASRPLPAPKGQNRLAQGRARRRSRRAPPWVRGHPRTSVALKGRNKGATNAPQSRETACRNDPNAGITRNVIDSLAFVLPVEAHESRPSISSRFAIIVSMFSSRSCFAPSGR